MKTQHNYILVEVPEYAKMLTYARQQKGILQAKIAKKLGVSHMQVSHFEKGKRIPRVDVLDQWADALGMELVITFRKKTKV